MYRMGPHAPVAREGPLQADCNSLIGQSSGLAIQTVKSCLGCPHRNRAQRSRHAHDMLRDFGVEALRARPYREHPLFASAVRVGMFCALAAAAVLPLLAWPGHVMMHYELAYLFGWPWPS